MAKRRGRGEGSIFQQTDGRWTAVVNLGFEDGKRRRKVHYGRTRAEVAKKLNRALGKHERGALVDTDDRVTVTQHLDQWLTNVSVRPRTRRQYEQVVRLYLKPAIGQVRLTQLQPDHVRAMVRGLETRGLSVRTATLARDVLRIALSQAVADELVGRNVAELVKRPKPTRRECDTLSAAEAQALLAALQGQRLEAVVTCGVALGLRLGEVLGLQWSDIADGRLSIRQALHVTGKRRELAPLKSKESRRTMPIPALVLRALERHKITQAERRLLSGAKWQRSDFVFTTRDGRPLDGTLVSRDLKTILARVWTGGLADCDHDRTRDRECLDCRAVRLPSLSFHGLRHSCASLLLAAGVPIRDVSELLGHSDVRLTLSTYAHVQDAGRTRTAGTIDRVFGPESQIDSLTDSLTDGFQRKK